MKARILKSLLAVVLGCFYAFCAYSATSLFSNYGQIQNVQNYSTNPFWSPNAPYNQRLPQPVYVQGNAVTTDECIRVIQSAVAFQCSARDNCKNTALSDIRPAIIVQLSNLPGKAYGTACAGYLDSVFESYVAQFGNNAPTRQVAFPDGTTPNPSINNNNNTIQMKNPYEIKTPQWQQEINERSRELQELQSENGAGNYGLSATAFPTTYNDLSFTERMANEAAGYAPYKDKSAYKTIEVKNAKEWCKDHDGPECDEYDCSIGGSKYDTPGCKLYRCAKEDYAKSHEEECVCATSGEGTDACMKVKCKSNNSSECHDWKCKNDQSYAAQAKNGCTKPITQTPPKDPKDDEQKLCVELTDKSQCCNKNETDCIQKLCDDNEEFKKKYTDLCATEEKPVVTRNGKEENNTDITTIARSLCSQSHVSKNKAKTMFKDIQTPNKDLAVLLSKILLNCINDLNYQDYDTQNYLHGEESGDNYIIFTNNNKSEYIKILFDDTSNNEIYDRQHIKYMWSAICSISGGTPSDNFFKWDNLPDYICHYYNASNISENLLDDVKRAFNMAFKSSKVDEKALITGCYKEGTQIRCSHE